MERNKRWVGCLAATIFIFLTAAPAAASGYTPEDSRWAITEAAQIYGVSENVLLTVALCETGDTLDPYAVGDWGHSHGIFQINDNPDYGLLDHYHAASDGASAYNPYQSARYFARVLAGYYPDVSPYRWTCFRIYYG